MRSITVKQLWWLHPAWLFALVVGSTMALAIAQTDQNYALYNTPKYVSAYHGVLAAGAIIVFVLGCQLALITGCFSKPNEVISLPQLKTIAHALFALTLFGYVVWLLVGIKNGFSPSIIRDIIFGDDAGITDGLKREIFKTIPGVTTCTQFAASAVLLGAFLFTKGYRQIAWAVAMVVSVTLVRSLALSERLALVELVVPLGLIIVRYFVIDRQLPIVFSWLMKAAPLLGVIFLMIFFGTAEYFRSWKFYQKDFDSVVEFTVWRISGYYTTAHNNSAMALATEDMFELPYYSIQSLWEFPGVSNSPIGYKNLTGVDPDEKLLYMLERFGTDELNNYGGLFAPAMDFGILGFFVFWFGSGFLSGRLYRSFMHGSIEGMMLYPVVVLCILEVPRHLYFSNQRIFPSLIAIVCVIWVVKRAASLPVVSPPSPGMLANKMSDRIA